jgi:hypothetical protein
MIGGCICCFDSYERWIRYLSSDAFSHMAVWGDGFYSSGQRSYFLKSRSGHNIKQLATAGNFTIWVFQIVISLAAPTFVMYWILFQDQTFTDEQTDMITSAVAPAFVALVSAAFVSQIFGGIFRGCIHSSIICYLADHEMFIDIQGFADEDMSNYFDQSMKKSHSRGRTAVHDDPHSGEDVVERSEEHPDREQRETT